ncbi:hypothetical protein K450DRAFT_241860 [Umbelopsis ramanniana AG]|uniref:Uncharacterized protein n=1 Tax=Umbelopsis ramanniana AG TaxID=1314678 RepID=A0AAD5EAL2_UMBRA|nr:uncharacterized protein K450DRAFT_241860 [Umbelopsis ramanniana AG]KAI8579380.1 hypothetical protein K450DRAFT_241860 [Umbelopsis ramanniana AG]
MDLEERDQMQEENVQGDNETADDQQCGADQDSNIGNTDAGSSGRPESVNRIQIEPSKAKNLQDDSTPLPLGPAPPLKKPVPTLAK